MAALPPLPGPLGLLGGYAPTIVRATASSRSVFNTGVIPLAAGPRRAPGIAILLAGAGPEPSVAPPPSVTPDAQGPGIARSAPRPAGHSDARSQRPQPPATGRSGDERSPGSPVGPPGRGVVAGSASAAGGGAAPVLFCAIIVTLLAFAAQELRRHRIRLVLAGPVGFVSPQQRPG